MVGGLIGPLLLWENASSKVISMASINLHHSSSLVFLDLLLLGDFSSSLPRPHVSFFPIIIHSMIPATASWIVSSINTPFKSPGIHYLIWPSLDAVSFNHFSLFFAHLFRVTCHMCILSSWWGMHWTHIHTSLHLHSFEMNCLGWFKMCEF